jgi:hypothetical protein
MMLTLRSRRSVLNDASQPHPDEITARGLRISEARFIVCADTFGTTGVDITDDAVALRLAGSGAIV